MRISESAGCPMQPAARDLSAREKHDHSQLPMQAAPACAGFGALILGLLLAMQPTASAQTVLSAEVNPQIWPQQAPPLPRDPAIERRIEKLLELMSLEEKVGQLIQADIGSISPADIARYPLGSVLAGGNSAPGGKQYATAAEWLALADAYHQASTTRGGVAIPLLFGIDAVHGHNNVIGATLFPHNIGLGATNDPALVGRIARATAVELRVTGAEWTFAPTLTVPRDDRWGRSYEGFSEDPQRVASFAAAVVRGLQGEPGSEEFLDDRHVLSSAKHFLGDGGTFGGRDQGDTRIDEVGLRDIHGAGYPPAIAAGVQSVMASFSSWNGVKLHGHHGLLTEVLRGRMGFDGFVVGDWNGHGQVPGCSNTRCPASIMAGVDMLMAPDSWRGLFDSTLAEARAKRLTRARLDEAVARILRVKLRMGLFDAPKPSERSLGGQFDLIGSAEHRALAREAVRRSLVLLKNSEGLLPLDPRRRIGIAGDGADNLSKQSGGWTLTWQGTGTRPEDFPGATSIWSGLRQQIEAAGGSAELALDGRFSQRPEVAIVVFGEDPYAEFQGDISTLAYRPDDDRDLQLLRSLRAQGIPTVAVFLSGRPLWVNRELNASDAFVAAWLPGSEGAGVADVLLRDGAGAVQHDFQGRLAFSWPARADQYTLNAGDADYQPLFPLGFGLDYDDDGALANLPEDFELGASASGTFFARGTLMSGARFELRDGSGTATATAASRAQSPAAALDMSGVDHLAQEDARRLRWHSEARFSIALDAPADLEREANGDVELVLELRAATTADSALELSLGCAQACAPTLDLGPALRRAGESWTRLGIPLKCLRSEGGTLDAVSAPLQLEAGADWVIDLAGVQVGSTVEHRLDCSD